MNGIKRFYGHLPIRWKLALWSSIVLFGLFATYNSLQYYVLNSWMMDQEERHIKEKMNEVQNFFADPSHLIDRNSIINSSRFLENIVEADELIRIMDRNGNLIVGVANNFSEEIIVSPIESGDLELVLIDGKHILVYRRPLITPGFVGYVEVIRDLKTYERLRGLIFLVTFSAGMGAILLSGLGGMIIAKQLLRPIAALTETMKRIKMRGLKERVPLDANQKDEVADLSRMFNEMMDDVELSFQKQKQFVEDASHELRTPIAILEGHLSLLNRWGKKDPEVLEESLKASQQEVERLRKLVLELLELTRLESDQFEIGEEEIDPVTIIEKTIANFELVHPDFKFVFHNLVKDKKNNSLRVAERHLEQLLMILMDNGIKYSQDKKLLEITAETNEMSKEWVFRIKDYGIGIPKEDIEKIFDRFYRVDKARSRAKGGHGLGLSIAQRIVSHYKGNIKAESKEEQWTEVIVTIPNSP